MICVYGQPDKIPDSSSNCCRFESYYQFHNISSKILLILSGLLILLILNIKSAGKQYYLCIVMYLHLHKIISGSISKKQMFIWSFIISSFSGLFMYSLIAISYFPTVSTKYPRLQKVGSHIYISDSHVCQISSNCFYFLSIP